MCEMANNNVARLEPILEDSVECLFFSSSGETDALFWETLCRQLNEIIQTLSENYIWQRDEFKVHIPIMKDRKEELPHHLESITCFGDNIEDEWFVVYLALELSKRYNNLIIQVRDNDGDFLLIEAADYLPSWANPESTDNRVFIHQNNIHIIPPNLQDSDSALSIEDAIQVIAQSSEKTKASHEILQSILQRIGKYPEKIEDSFHRATVKLPVDIAAILTVKPALVAPLVNSYCNHDVIDARACKNEVFEDCVTVTVKFTKCLYAMLMHAKPVKNVKFRNINDKKSVTGQKLTIGFKILMNKPTQDIFSTKQFKNFMGKLNASGYFKNNIAGSADYKELLNNAKEFYSVMECPINAQVSNDILQLINSSKFAKTKEALLQELTSNDELVEDNDDWLNINPDQLNNLLDERYGKKGKFDTNDVLTANNVTSKLSSFLMQTSDFEGIETNRNTDIKDSVDFDPDDFSKSVQKMLDLITLGDAKEKVLDSDEDFYDSGEDVDDELNDIKQDQVEDPKTILQNIVQSMKEEGLSGPTSNLMKTAGFNKTDFLDSDDDDE